MRVSTTIDNVTIIDGTGNGRFKGMVAIQDDSIVHAGPQTTRFTALRTIDGKGKILVPGFIDMHGHSDLQLLRDPGMAPKISQGIVTEVIGNCGMGAYPLGEIRSKRRLLGEMASDILGDYADTWPWKDFETFADTLEHHGSGTNVVGLQAHTPLRIAAMQGNPNRLATSQEIDGMRRLLKQSYEQGAAGFSSGLYYAPCLFASREELLALLHLTAEYDRLFAVHHRCEGDGVVDSLREVLELARQTGVRIEVSHLKAIGRRNQQFVPQMLALVDDYAAKGVRVTFDQYPYTYGSTSLYSLLPPEYLQLERDVLLSKLARPEERVRMRSLMLAPDGWDSLASLCGWEDISVMHVDGLPELKGRSFASLAQESGMDPFDVFFDMLTRGPAIAVMSDVTQSDGMLERILMHPLGYFGTDSLYSGAVYHPRSTQATRHLFATYFKEKQPMPLEQLVKRMTSAPAQCLRLEDRGVVRCGYKADLALLDLETLTDEVDDNRGISLVMSNGKVVWEQGRMTGVVAGRVLRSRSG